MDFTIRTYKQFLQALNNGNYTFLRFAEYIEKPAQKVILLRHDVEKQYENALKFARIENKLNIRSTYYFRFCKNHYKENIVKEIARLGHEIGYHYDDLAKCKGNYQKAIERFEKNLSILRKIAPVKSICMDGSPLSKYDNKDLWNKYNYRDYDLVGEPYLDINFREVLYLTDTGRRWDGEKVSIRDKVNREQGTRNKNDEYRISTQHLSFHTTNDIIQAAKTSQLPDKIMFTFHPQRWTDKPWPWVKELVWQNMKNQIKKFMVKR